MNPSPTLAAGAETTASATSAAVKPALPRFMKIGWGIGTIGPIMLLSATNALQLRFITDFIGISAGVASLLLVISKLYDAFFDPAMGWLSDHTVSRWGRRRPYLILGGLMLALSLIAMFTVPPFESVAARTIYTGVVLVFYATGYTVFNIPYMSMPAEMTSSSAERTEIIGYRVYAVGVSQIISMFLGAALVQKLGGGASAYMWMAILLSPIVLISSIIAFRATANAPFTLRTHTKVPFKEQARSVLSNRPYMLLITVKLLTLMTLSAQSIFPFFFANVLHADLLKLGTYFAVVSLGFIFSQPLWLWVTRRWSKAVTYQLTLFLSLPVWLSWLYAGSNEPLSLIYLRGALVGILGGGSLLAGQAMLPDTMEYDYLRTGLRREGIFAGFYTTVEKIAGAVGIGLVGFLLSQAGYIESRGASVVQPQAALDAIHYIVACLPAALSLVSGILMLGYKLNETMLNRLRAANKFPA